MLSTQCDADLIAVAAGLSAPGKGLLASDESPGTLGKRLAKAGIENTEEQRRLYRELFYTAPIGDAGISGAILFPEALAQAASDGTPFVRCLQERGVLAGVKVDEGLHPLVAKGAAPGDTATRGLDGLRERCDAYRAQGASFAKWRAALQVGGDGRGCPSEAAIEANAAQLAEYAAVCQAAGLVPVVEPELLIDGHHDIHAFGAATVRTVFACVAHLCRRGVVLEATLLKPQMVLPGADWAGPRPAPAEVAAHTLRALRQCVPPAVPGVMFLSGGQTEEEATTNLNAINVAARAEGRAPWALSFSFGRALQASVLQLWSQDRGHVKPCRRMASALARANGAAARGEYEGPHPSATSRQGSLRESFRGWRTDVPGAGAPAAPEAAAR